MGKEPNKVKSNVGKRFMDIPAQGSAVEFKPSDFQDELDSRILVRETAKALSWNRHSPKRP